MDQPRVRIEQMSETWIAILISEILFLWFVTYSFFTFQKQKHYRRTSLLIKAFQHKFRLDLELNTWVPSIFYSSVVNLSSYTWDKSDWDVGHKYFGFLHFRRLLAPNIQKREFLKEGATSISQQVRKLWYWFSWYSHNRINFNLIKL